jgi:hypothetical protein
MAEREVLMVRGDTKVLMVRGDTKVLMVRGDTKVLMVRGDTNHGGKGSFNGSWGHEPWQPEPRQKKPQTSSRNLWLIYKTAVLNNFISPFLVEALFLF